MAKITLDINNIEKEFFAGYRLLAIAAPATPDYRFCWMLNHYLDMRFKRCPESDISINITSKNQAFANDLFTGLDMEVHSRMRYFPVYRHAIEGAELSLLLYSNLCEGSRLVREIPAADFLLLFPDNPLIYESDKARACGALKCVTWIKEIDINELTSKTALIL